MFATTAIFLLTVNCAYCGTIINYRQEKNGYRDALLQPFEQDDKYDQLLSPASMNPKKQKVTVGYDVTRLSLITTFHHVYNSSYGLPFALLIARI